MHLWTAPRMNIKHLLHWNCTMLGEGTLSNVDAVPCLLKLMGKFQLEWHISYGKAKGHLPPKHIGWQSIEGCKQWDLNNLQTTAGHSDLRLLLKKSLDKLVLFCYSEHVKWMISFLSAVVCPLMINCILANLHLKCSCVWGREPV